jgi:type 1 glutamine amidotransferase
MKHRCFLLLLAVLMAGSLPGLAETHRGKIRVLIVDGFSNHDWQQTTQLLRGILQAAGEFTVDVSTAPQETGSAAWEAWRPRFSDYDVVIQTCNDNGGNGLLQGLKQKPDWPDAVKRDFADYVRKGGGVYIFHAAENAFVGWKEYEEMVGLSWRHADYGTAIRVSDSGELVRIPAGEGRGTGHGQRSNVLVTRLGNDPIHSGMPRAWLSPDMEVYFYARGPAERLHVLAYARDSDPKLGLLWPVEWTTTYGKGRVYISTYGHVWPGDIQPPGLRDAAVETIIPRALEWLARRPVKFPVPADFPDASAVSVRDRIPAAF